MFQYNPTFFKVTQALSHVKDLRTPRTGDRREMILASLLEIINHPIFIHFKEIFGQ